MNARFPLVDERVWKPLGRGATVLLAAAVACLWWVGSAVGQSTAISEPAPRALSAREYAASKAWLRQAVVGPRARASADARRIKLVADAGAANDRQIFPLGVGIPFREGQVARLGELGIESAAQGPLPAAFTTRTTWPDGSLQWVWADFEGKLDREYYLTIGQRAAVPPVRAMRVAAGETDITVNNGALEIRWQRAYATPVEVRLVTADGKQTVVAAGDGRGIYFIDQDDRRAVLGGPQAELQFDVESSNPLRTVLRIEGWYVCGEQQVARAVVRYHLYRNQPWMKVEHTFIVTRDNDEQWYKEIGIVLPLNGGDSSTVHFGVQETDAVVLDVSDGQEGSIYQDRYPLYHYKQSHYVARKGSTAVADGAVAAGWAELHNGGASLLLAVADFAPQFPKELAATRDGLTARLWSGRDGRILDYKPATLARQWWGQWLDRLDYSRDQIRAKQRMQESGKESDSAYFTIEQIRSMNPGCVGVARTHALLAAWHLGPADPARAAALLALLERPPVVQPDPHWVCHADPRVVTRMIARGEGGPEYEIVERGIAAWLGELTSRREAFPYTGWYEWGKHTNLAYERAADGTIYAQWYRLTSNNPYYYNLNMVQSWMRGGDRAYLEETERVNRWLADYGFIHWGGGRDNKKKGQMSNGHTRAPVYWSGTGRLSSPSTEAVTGFAYEYLLRDNRRLADLFPPLTEAYLNDFNFEYQETADVTLMTMGGLYRVNQDPRLLDRMRTYVRMFTDPESPTGLRDSFWKTPANLIYKSHRKCYLLIQYHDLTGDEEVVPIIVKLAIAMFDHYGPRYTQPFYYQHRLGGIAARVYQWTGDPDMQFWARHQLAGAAELFQRFEELPPEKKGAARARSGNPTSDAFPAYVFDNVGFAADWMPGKGLLYVNHDSTPAILALPVAIDVLRNQQDARR